MSGRKKISYVQNDEPSFIKQFKQRVGYQEGPNVETKNAELPSFDDEDEDNPLRDDEKPVVVVLREGDLTAEEAEKYDQDTSSDKPHAEGDKIMFRKPTKRTGENDLSSTSNKKKKDLEAKCKKSDDSKTTKNKQLLSFDDEEEDDT
ncbi:hypothetical protein ScPMuIL_001538 [Solemya velum]